MGNSATLEQLREALDGLTREDYQLVREFCHALVHDPAKAARMMQEIMEQAGAVKGGAAA